MILYYLFIIPFAVFIKTLNFIFHHLVLNKRSFIALKTFMAYKVLTLKRIKEPVVFLNYLQDLILFLEQLKVIKNRIKHYEYTHLKLDGREFIKIIITAKNSNFVSDIANAIYTRNTYIEVSKDLVLIYYFL